MNNIISKRLKIMRNNFGATQQEVADGVEIELLTYGRYERGLRMPTAENLSKLADFFNCSTDYLLGMTDNPQRLIKLTGNDIPQPLKDAGALSVTIGEDDYKRMTEDELRKVAMDALAEIERRKREED